MSVYKHLVFVDKNSKLFNDIFYYVNKIIFKNIKE